MNLRLEIHIDTGPETCDWITVPGTVTSLMREPEANSRVRDYIKGGWRAALEQAAKNDCSRHPNVYLDLLRR